MPIAAIPSRVPVPMPGTKTIDPVVSPEAFTIDCADCIHRQTPVCDDCVVSFIVSRQPDDAIVVDADEARAVRLLEQAGLVPGVRHSRQVGGPAEYPSGSADAGHDPLGTRLRRPPSAVQPWSVLRSSYSRAGQSAPTHEVGRLDADVVALGLRSGLTAIGIADAGVFEETLAVLHARKRRGLHSDMQFTYRNPERSTDPRRIVPDARSLVVGAWSYRHQEPQPVALPSVRADPSAASAPAVPVDPSDPEPTLAPHASRPVGRVARYASKDHYALLRLALASIADHLSGLGWQAKVVCDDNALVDRAAAHRAGLGWFGKNSLLLSPELGSWFVLGTVVTDAPLQPTAPLEASAHGQQCGSCSRCLSACPTGALVEPGVVDARRCLAWLVQAPGSFPEQYRRALGNRIYGCDDCQQVCPINRITDRRDPPPPSSADDRPWIDLLDLLESTDDELLAAHGRWYIAGRDPRYLRRNALVALGNVGDGRDLATEQALRHWLGVNDPMLVEHAQWAARQLHRDDLVEQTT